LDPLYRRADAWQKLAALLEVQLLFVDDKPRRIEILREIAQIKESRGQDPQAAFQALSRAWLEEAGEGESREQPLFEELCRLAGLIAGFAGLVSILEKAVEGSYDFELTARVWARIARIQDEQLSDRSQAIEAWRKVTGVHDEDDQAWQNLERLLTAEERSSELVLVLEKRFTLVSDSAEQKRLLYLAAKLHETVLGAPDKAIATWRQVLQLDDRDGSALVALGRLYESRDAWRDLTWVYGQQIEQADSEATRRTLRFAMARVYEDKLGDSFEAMGAYKSALESNASDTEALTALGRLYEKESQWADHLEILDKLAALKDDESQVGERLMLWLQAARVTEEKIQESDAAIRRYEQILTFEPSKKRAVAAVLGTQADAKLALERLVQSPETRAQAAAVLEPLYRKHSEWRPLIDLLELSLSSAADPSERRRILAQIAGLQEAGLSDATSAFATWGRILSEDGSDEEAMRELERWRSSAASTASWRRSSSSGWRRRAIPRCSGCLRSSWPGCTRRTWPMPSKAIERYRRVRELPGDEMEALRALDRLLQKSGALAELAEVLEREAEVADAPTEQAEFLFRLGELKTGSLYDLDGALQAFRKALERFPQHVAARAAVERLINSPAHAVAALDLLEPLAEQERDFGKLVELLEVRVGVTQGKPERAALLERMANLAEKEIGDTSRAFDAVARAFIETPDETRLTDEMERLARSCGRDSDAALKLEEVLDRVTFGMKSSDSGRRMAADMQRELGLRAARIWERLSDDQRAETRYQTVLDLENDNHEALAALERIYRQRGDATLLAEMLLQARRTRRQHRQAQVAADRSGGSVPRTTADEFKAVEAWKKILELDETDGKALSSLAELYHRSRRFEELVSVLTTQARLLSGNAKANILARIADLLSEELDQSAQAIEVYRELLGIQPGSLKALSALEALYSRREDWAQVQEVLGRRLKAVPQTKDKVAVLRKLAQLSLDKLRSVDDAVSHLQQVLEIQPGDPDAQADLERLLEAGEKWYELVDVLVRHADASHKLGKLDEVIALLLRAAEIWEGKVQAPEQAKKLLERVLELDPNHVRALMSLARIYESQHDWARCKATLEKAVRLAKTNCRDGRAVLPTRAHGSRASG
jgi:tetratricopeptide (TPR) repeat protein